MQIKLKKKDINKIMEVLILSNTLKVDFTICDDYVLIGAISYLEKVLMEIIMNGSYDNYINLEQIRSDLIKELLQGCAKFASDECFSSEFHDFKTKLLSL